MWSSLALASRMTRNSVWADGRPTLQCDRRTCRRTSSGIFEISFKTAGSVVSSPAGSCSPC
eukprot:9812951-Heterocapsa_arctica.AAC.1